MHWLIHRNNNFGEMKVWGINGKNVLC